MREYIETIREGLVCERCGKYIGSLAVDSYLPPLYPVAVDGSEPEDEVRALVAFEWHMLGMLKQGKFTVRHPSRDDVCVSLDEWARDDEDDEAAEEEPE